MNRLLNELLCRGLGSGALYCARDGKNPVDNVLFPCRNNVNLYF
ncbi:hypothetical protein HMPREF3038_00763 [Akkermansia sp. KLE1797]|nr:hypothetical protein HMPREF3038_00763 [Akkermansia sp. KLE1797]KXU54582.1 hypothetical protein HMPREF3039_01479 [Akkermansia sp. KLE1798]KZA04975.1 hypothetical protein HMPREF1326_01557 [Akkermansia sp. KLE1605]